MIETSNIIMHDWIEFHPYDNPTPADNFGVNLSKKIHKLILHPEHKSVVSGLGNKGSKRLAVFMTCYFEDIVNMLGMYEAFISEHQRLYGKYLPFFDDEDYEDGLINWQDVASLLWYFISTNFKQEGKATLLNPYSSGLINLAISITEIFDTEWDEAPDNDQLFDYYHIDEKETDLYNVRFRVQALCSRSYLFHNYPDKLLKILEQVKSKWPETTQEQYNSFIYTYSDELAFNEPLPLLAMKPHQLFAGMLGDDHNLYKPLMEIGRKRVAMLIYLHSDDIYHCFEHPATGREVKISRKSLDDLTQITSGTVVRMGLVWWMKEWWFSGSLMVLGKPNEKIKKEFFTISEASVFSDLSDQKDILKEQFELFIEFNKGKQIAFFNTFFDANTFLREFMLRWNFRMREKMKKNTDDVPPFLPTEIAPGIVAKKDSPTIVFFNSETGTEIYTDMNALIPDPENILYNPSHNPKKLMSMLFDVTCSTEFVKFLVKEYGIEKHFLFPAEKKAEIIPKNLDFFLRFWKSKSYHPEPQIHPVDAKRWK